MSSFKKLWTYILFTIIVSLIFAPWTGHPFDIMVWLKTGKLMLSGADVYAPDNHLGYPPVWAYWCGLAYLVFLASGSSLEIWRVFVKLPLIAAHLGLAYLVYRFYADKISTGNPLAPSRLVIIWSFFFYVGAVWGQLNSLSALLAFLAFDRSARNRPLQSALVLGAGVAIKLFPIVLAPIFFAHTSLNHGKTTGMLYIPVMLALPALITSGSILAFGWDPMNFFATLYFQPMKLTLEPHGVMNWWSYLDVLQIDPNRLIALQFIWIPTILGYAYFWSRKSTSVMNLNHSIITTFFLFMILYPRVPEQSFLDPLPFMFLEASTLTRRKLYLWSLAFLQLGVYAFSILNGGLLLPASFLEKFYPEIQRGLEAFLSANADWLWKLRGYLGLLVTAGLILFLFERKYLFCASSEKPCKQ